MSIISLINILSFLFIHTCILKFFLNNLIEQKQGPSQEYWVMYV